MGKNDQRSERTKFSLRNNISPIQFFLHSSLRLNFMNCLIVDDNNIARTTLIQLASQISDLRVSGDFENAMEAYNYLISHNIDLLLLDIEMPGMSGVELTKQLASKRPLIIYTTSKKEYATEAFDLNVVDYITKPITPSRFLQAIDKAREILNSKKTEIKSDEDSFVFIRDSNNIRRLKMDDILFAEAMGDYVKLHTTHKFYAVHTTLKAVENRLPESKFIKVHRSFIVALSKIDTIQDGAIVISGKSIPVADAFRAALNARMKVL